MYLIVAPDPSRLGGVANYYRVLKSYLPDSCRFFYLSAKEQHRLRLISVITDCFRFISFFNKNEDEVILLNPSFDLKALFRDGIFLLISKCIFKKKVIVFFRGWNDRDEKIVSNDKFKIFKNIYSLADQFIVLGETFNKKLESLGVKKKTHIETTTFDDRSLNKKDVLKHISQYNNKKINLLFLSRVEKAKGIYKILESYRQLKIKYPQLCLSIAGSGNALSKLKSKVERYDIPDVHFLGYVCGSNKVSAFMNADLFLFPSDHGEGMPNSVLEAMAYGLPVITHTVGGMVDFFEDRKMGYSIIHNDISHLSEGIEWSIKCLERRKKIANYNFEFSCKNFAASKVAMRLICILKQAKR